MLGLPWSLVWFVVTAVVYALQLFPVTGIVLMMLLAPLWSILTVNLGFVGIAIEAAVGRVSRVWLALPLIWFGGYAVAAHQSRLELERLDTSLRAINATRSLPFDVSSGAIVVAEDPNNLGDFPRRLVRDHLLPVAYMEPMSSRRDSSLAPLTTRNRAWRMGTSDTCAKIRSDQRMRDASIHVTSPVARASAGHGCQYSLPEDPSAPAWRVTAKSEALKTFLVAGKITRITVSAPDGRRIELQTGHATALALFPMPVIGCWLNSGAPKWECAAGFMKKAHRGLGGAEPYGGAGVEIVAKALGIPSRTKATDVEAGPVPQIDAVVRGRDETALANLDRVLADPTIRATVHDLAGLAQRPSALVERSARILEAMSQALAHGRGDSETARNLQQLLAALPDAEFHRIADELLRRLDEGRPRIGYGRQRSPPSERIDHHLATRLGDLGTASLPVLERLVFTMRPSAAAILGLCRMGRESSHLAERLSVHARSAANLRSEERAATYVTLIRWGRDDLASQMLETANEDWQRRNYASRWPNLASGAGPEYCTLRYRS